MSGVSVFSQATIFCSLSIAMYDACDFSGALIVGTCIFCCGCGGGGTDREEEGGGGGGWAGEEKLVVSSFLFWSL